MSVDLPAPFSPSTTWTSPARTSRSTPSSATTPGKRLLTPRTSRTTPPGARSPITDGSRRPSRSTSRSATVTPGRRARPPHVAPVEGFAGGVAERPRDTIQLELPEVLRDDAPAAVAVEHARVLGRSMRALTVVSGAVSTRCRLVARPPRKRPGPPESGRRRYDSVRKGYLLSKTSTGAFRQFPFSGHRTLPPSWVAVPPQP